MTRFAVVHKHRLTEAVTPLSLPRRAHFASVSTDREGIPCVYVSHDLDVPSGDTPVDYVTFEIALVGTGRKLILRNDLVLCTFLGTIKVSPHHDGNWVDEESHTHSDHMPMHAFRVSQTAERKSVVTGVQWSEGSGIDPSCLKECKKCGAVRVGTDLCERHFQ